MCRTLCLRQTMQPVNETLDTLRDCALRVLHALGQGHSEAVYHSALLCELNARHIPYRTEVCCPFLYDSQCVGHGRADVVVRNVAVEIKVGEAPSAAGRAQLQRYIESLGRIEGREFVGVLLRIGRSVSKLRMQALDSDGDVIYTHPPLPPPEAADPLAREDAVVMEAFRKRYKFSRSATAGVPLARLRAHLYRAVPARRVDSTGHAVERFIRRHFVSAPELRTARSRSVVVCRPLQSRGVILV